MLRVAIVFTLGCSVLVCNAILSILPLISDVRLPDGCIYLQGVLSVLSCTLFLVGSAFAFLEAWKLDDTAEPGFGSKMQGVSQNQTTITESEKTPVEKLVDIPSPVPEAHCTHYSSSHADLFKHANSLSAALEVEKAAALYDRPLDKTQRYANNPRLSRTRYLELGIFASTIFLCSSALYCATSIVSLVTIIQSETILRCIRYPQLLAASGFAIASLLLIIKAQRDSHDRWWRLQIWSPGVQVNILNLIGSTGFVFCAYFGLLEHAFWAQQQFGYSYLWGSWAFLLGSIISWYKSLQGQDYSVDVWKVEKSPV
ncbi:hypothetical protein LTR09_010051 [Extremus antarcticus]|uniref:Uncharacterized protein n=1 Tax=Extremus antarcticus TaxID=702011 RepID=A0AAJ0D7W6_9PEZI|nr:hypothetical protein LTR09_010051 [Extremus antarcticus]